MLVLVHPHPLDFVHLWSEDNGHGSYALRGETRTKPGFSNESGVYQAVEQFFKLNTEVRTSDRASFFLDFRLFENDRESHLGDSTQLNECPQDIGTNDTFSGTNQGRNTNCTGVQQNSLEPRYQDLVPRVEKAYAKYSTDYCLLTVGRRPRDWGMGMFMSSGDGFFDSDSSIYDGITCDINLQKSQVLGFSFGYDKLSETGATVLTNSSADTNTYGPSNKSDDLDQIFVSLEYNDHKMNAGKGFSQQVAIYFANVFGGKNNGTDIKLADLYLNFLVSDLLIQNEILFRLGDSADPNLALLGGRRSRDADTEVKNNVSAIAAAGSIEYFLSRSGSVLGPSKFKKGTAVSHSLFFDYAIAPGDEHGYFPEYADNFSDSSRDTTVKAVAFHRNFKPAMILFNGKSDTDSTRIDGVFDPYRVMNATVLSLGYRYKSLENGNFELKLISANLSKTLSDESKALYTDVNARPIGYHGTNLGTELNLSYNKSLGQGLELGISGAYAKGGDAWKTKDSEDPADNSLVQGHVAFSF